MSQESHLTLQFLGAGDSNVGVTCGDGGGTDTGEWSNCQKSRISGLVEDVGRIASGMPNRHPTESLLDDNHLHWRSMDDRSHPSGLAAADRWTYLHAPIPELPRTAKTTRRIALLLLSSFVILFVVDLTLSL